MGVALLGEWSSAFGVPVVVASTSAAKRTRRGLFEWYWQGGWLPRWMHWMWLEWWVVRKVVVVVLCWQAVLSVFPLTCVAGQGGCQLFNRECPPLGGQLQADPPQRGACCEGRTHPTVELQLPQNVGGPMGARRPRVPTVKGGLWQGVRIDQVGRCARLAGLPRTRWVH